MYFLHVTFSQDFFFCFSQKFIIYRSPSNSSSSSSSSSDSDSDSSTDSNASSTATVEGIEGYAYGGYGHCYKCGKF